MTDDETQYLEERLKDIESALFAAETLAEDLTTLLNDDPGDVHMIGALAGVGQSIRHLRDVTLNSRHALSRLRTEAVRPRERDPDLSKGLE